MARAYILTDTGTYTQPYTYHDLQKRREELETERRSQAPVLSEEESWGLRLYEQEQAQKKTKAEAEQRAADRAAKAEMLREANEQHEKETRLREDAERQFEFQVRIALDGQAVTDKEERLVRRLVAQRHRDGSSPTVDEFIGTLFKIRNSGIGERPSGLLPWSGVSN